MGNLRAHGAVRLMIGPIRVRDGPAATFTDGRRIGTTPSRNGVREFRGRHYCVATPSRHKAETSRGAHAIVIAKACPCHSAWSINSAAVPQRGRYPW